MDSWVNKKIRLLRKSLPKPNSQAAFSVMLHSLGVKKVSARQVYLIESGQVEPGDNVLAACCEIAEKNGLIRFIDPLKSAMSSPWRTWALQERGPYYGVDSDVIWAIGCVRRILGSRDQVTRDALISTLKVFIRDVDRYEEHDPGIKVKVKLEGD